MKQAEPKANIESAPPPTQAPESIERVAVAIAPTVEPTQPQVTDYEQNLKILEAITVHPEAGTVYHIDDLTKAGFNYDACSGRGTLHNIDPKLNCHFVQYGKYRIYRVDFSHVLIHKYKHLKTKTDD